MNENISFTKKTKRIIALALVLVLCLAMVPIATFASEDGTCETCGKPLSEGYVCTLVEEGHSDLVCGIEEHAAVDPEQECEICEASGLETCEGHEHSDGCYQWVEATYKHVKDEQSQEPSEEPSEEPSDDAGFKYDAPPTTLEQMTALIKGWNWTMDKPMWAYEVDGELFPSGYYCAYVSADDEYNDTGVGYWTWSVGIVPLAGTYSVTVTVRLNSNNVNGATVTVTDSQGDTKSVTTGSSGQATISGLASGTASIAVTYTSGGTSYTGTGTANISTSGSNTASISLSQATTTFGHIDIGAAGSFTYDVDGVPTTVNINFETAGFSGVTLYQDGTPITITGKWQSGGTSGREYRITGTFPRYATYKFVYTFTVTIDGSPVSLTYTGEFTFDGADNVCPGTGTSKGLDVDLDGEDLGDFFRYGTLKINKTISGNTPASKATFTFNVYGPINHPTIVASDRGDYTISGVGYVTIPSLPVGTYIITEKNIPAGYEVNGSERQAILKPEAELTNVYFDNYYQGDTPTTGTLKIIKNVTGLDSNRAFSFEVKKDDGMVVGTYTINAGAFVGGNGSYSIPGLGADSYTVTEKNPDVDGYDCVTSPSVTQSAVVSVGDTAIVTFNNAYTVKVYEYPVSYSVTGDAPATSSDIPATVNYTSGIEVDVAAGLTTTETTKDGKNGIWTFNGWTTSDATVSGGKFDMPAKAVALVGTWVFTEAEYPVSYSVEGDAPSAYSTVPDTVNYKQGTEVSVAGGLTTTETTKNGKNGTWTFNGWTTSDAIVSGGKFDMPAKAVALVGTWVFTEAEYPVSYSVEGDAPSAYSTVPDTVNYKQGTEVSVAGGLTTTETTKDSKNGTWTFNGWTTTDVTVAGGKFDMPAEAVAIIGTWTFTATKYNVTYELTSTVNPTDANTAPTDASEYTSDQSADVKADMTTAETTYNGQTGVWTFSGWSVKSPTATSIADGKVSLANGSVELEGYWTFVPEYAVTYEWDPTYETYLDAVTLNEDNDRHIEGATVDFVNYEAFSPILVVINGVPGVLTFKEWISDPEVDVSLAKFTMPNSDVKFTGYWELTTLYTVTYEWKGDYPTNAPDLPTDTNLYYDTNTADIDATIAIGYNVNGSYNGVNGVWTFRGWKEAVDDNDTPVTINTDDVTGGSSLTIPKSNVIVYGAWEFAATVMLQAIPYNNVYDAQYHSIRIADGTNNTVDTTLEGDVYYYSLNDLTDDDINWLTEIPTFTDVTGSSITVYVKAVNEVYGTRKAQATVTITPRPITITANSARYRYTGAMRYVTDYSITSGSLAANASGVAETYTASAYGEGRGVSGGTRTYTVYMGQDSNGNTVATNIRKTDGSDSTSNYTITLRNGSLEIWDTTNSYTPPTTTTTTTTTPATTATVSLADPPAYQDIGDTTTPLAQMPVSDTPIDIADESVPLGPVTGDVNPIALLICLLVISGAAIVIVGKKRFGKSN